MISVATKRKLAVMFFVCLLLFKRKIHKKKIVECGKFLLRSHIYRTYTLSVARLKNWVESDKSITYFSISHHSRKAMKFSVK
jgi:hypothetical protein